MYKEKRERVWKKESNVSIDTINVEVKYGGIHLHFLYSSIWLFIYTSFIHILLLLQVGSLNFSLNCITLFPSKYSPKILH